MGNGNTLILKIACGDVRKRCLDPTLLRGSVCGLMPNHERSIRPRVNLPAGRAMPSSRWRRCECSGSPGRSIPAVVKR
jgi:hypothetical protein